MLYFCGVCNYQFINMSDSNITSIVLVAVFSCLILWVSFSLIAAGLRRRRFIRTLGFADARFIKYNGESRAAFDDTTRRLLLIDGDRHTVIPYSDIDQGFFIKGDRQTGTRTHRLADTIGAWAFAGRTAAVIAYHNSQPTTCTTRGGMYFAVRKKNREEFVIDLSLGRRYSDNNPIDRLRMKEMELFADVMWKELRKARELES